MSRRKFLILRIVLWLACKAGKYAAMQEFIGWLSPQLQGPTLRCHRPQYGAEMYGRDPFYLRTENLGQWLSDLYMNINMDRHGWVG